MTTKPKPAPTDNHDLRAWQLSLYTTPAPHQPPAPELWPLDANKPTLIMWCHDDGCEVLTDDAASVGAEPPKE